MVRVLEADGLPGLAGIRGAPHSVATADVAAHGDFSAADIDDIGIRIADSDSADGAAEELVGDILPASSCVDGLPDPATASTKVVRVEITQDSGAG